LGIFARFKKKPQLKNQRKAYLYAIASVLCWSTVAVAFKMGLRSLSVLQLLTYSCYTSIFCLFINLVVKKKINELRLLNRMFLLKSALLGLLNPLLYYLVLFKAYTLLPAQIAQPLNYTWPLILVALSIIFLKQKIALIAIAGIVVSLMGVLVISLQGHSSFAGINNPVGVIFSTGSAFIWATYWLLNANRSQYEETGMFVNFLFAGLFATILMLFTGGFERIPLNGILSSVYIGVFEMGLTFLLWLKALKFSNDAGKVSHLVYFSPFISLLFIHLILKESIYFTTFLGLILIIAGVILSKIKRWSRIKA
jgi:drug/metabolite transporter (DMT)-like permease